jgi:hypothetical protein
VTYRPEKEHSTQLHSFKLLLENHPELRSGPAGVKLVLVGGSRNEEDKARVDGLKKLAEDLNVSVRTSQRIYDLIRYRSLLSGFSLEERRICRQRDACDGFILVISYQHRFQYDDR